MRKYFNLQLFDTDAQIIDRTGAEALIPEENAREIIQGAVAQSAALSMGRRLANMTSKQTKLPVLDALPIAYFVDGDTEQKKTTKQQWDKKILYAEEVAVIVPIPEAVLDDADYDIWGEVRPRIQEAFGKVIDQAIFFSTGKPTNWRAGLVPSATAAGATVALGTNDLYDVIMGEGGVIAKVEESGFFVSGHLADISMRAKLRGLKDKQDRPLFLASMQQAGNYTLDGSAMTFPRNGLQPAGLLHPPGHHLQALHRGRGPEHGRNHRIQPHAERHGRPSCGHETGLGDPEPDQRAEDQQEPALPVRRSHCLSERRAS